MRLDNWDLILSDEIEAARTRPFEYGRHDCVTWAMSVRAKILGIAQPDWIGRYKTEKGAARVLKRAGYDSLEEAGRGVLGVPLSSPLMAQRGDIVLGEAFGVCIGSDAVFPGETGLRAVSIMDTRMAWRV